MKRYIIALLTTLLCAGTSPAQESDAAHRQQRLIPDLEAETSTSAAAEPEQMVHSLEQTWIRQLHLKSNAAGLGLGIANLGVEVDLASHWSLNLPVYYSAWDYFKTTLKFRTLAIQPGLRYWPSAQHDRWFIEAHFGMAYYNIAYNGDYRYQDHNRETPALGGGLSVGYRLPLGKDRRWRVEFALGGGGYALHYDKFYNTKVTQEGFLVESVRKTYWGIDQVAISFSYTWDLTKKGGRP